MLDMSLQTQTGQVSEGNLTNKKGEDKGAKQLAMHHGQWSIKPIDYGTIYPTESYG